jgi:hypothetical protein
VPLADASLSVMVDPVQSEEAPVIAVGAALTVTAQVALVSEPLVLHVPVPVQVRTQ